MVPTEQLFIGETVPVQLRASSNYLVSNEALFGAVSGGSLVVRYLDVNNLPLKILVSNEVSETG